MKKHFQSFNQFFYVMKMASAKQIFDSLPGIWRITRETLTPLKQWQNSGAECIKASGYAAFISAESDPNLLLYSEKVRINSGDDASNSSGMNGLEAKQKYKFRYDNSTSSITKYFFDDRLFYTLKIDDKNDNTTEATASNVITVGCGTHLCIQDLYEANYSFHNDKYFELTYTINGPKKCYEIINTYEKCNDDEVNELAIQIENAEIL